MSNEEFHKKTLTIVTALAAAQVLHEALDEVSDTEFFRQSLKLSVKKTQQELEKVCDKHITNMWNIDEKIMRDIIQGIEETSKQLAHLDPTRIVELGYLFKNGDLEYVDKK